MDVFVIACDLKKGGYIFKLLQVFMNTDFKQQLPKITWIYYQFVNFVFNLNERLCIVRKPQTRKKKQES